MIDTPTVDWLALSPTIALLVGAGVALLSALLPAWTRKAVAAAASFAAFVVAAALAGYVFTQSAPRRCCSTARWSGTSSRPWRR